MKPASLFVGLCLATAFSAAHAETFRMPEGIILESSTSLELTYQNIPAYDAFKKVIVGWDNGKLLYVIDVTRLPQGANDGEHYLDRLLFDIGGNSAGHAVNVRSKGEYQANSGLSGRYVDYRYVPAGRDRAQQQVVHFLSDSRISFTVFVSVVDVAATGRALRDSLALLKTATLTVPPLPHKPETGDPGGALVGRWTAARKVSDEATVETLTELRADRSFTGRGVLNGQVVVEYLGTWSSDGQHIDWNYVHSSPPLDERYRNDQDTIVFFDGKTLTLRSRESGLTRSLLRSEQR